jgi:hypothetical protein
MVGAPESNLGNILYSQEYLIVPSITILKLITLCPVVALNSVSATGIGDPSIGVALLKSLKSKHTRSLPFFL